MQRTRDRRKRMEHGAASACQGPSGIAPLRAWTLIVVGVVMTSASDWITAQVAWFGPVYLLIIGFAAWSLGWRPAAAVATVCVVTGFWLNGLNLYPYGTIAASWNLALRIGAILATIGLVETLRDSYARQWRLARIDPLTGAMTRQAFFEAHDHDPVRGWSLLAYLDLDGFKALNDAHGHGCGDQSLQDFVLNVRKLIRKEDILARIGGDEFIVYMNVKDEAAAHMVAMRLHRKINGAQASPGPKLSCSVGVLILPPGERNIDTEIRLADELMYHAKESGGSIAIATASTESRRPELLEHLGSRAFDAEGRAISANSAGQGPATAGAARRIRRTDRAAA